MKYLAKIDLENKNNSHTQAYELVEKVSAGHSLKILEVGCSSGYLGAALKEAGHQVFGIEPSHEAAQAAANVLDNVFEGTVQDFFLQFSDLKFNVVIYGDVLEHLADPESILDLTREHLTPTGVVIASVPNVAHICMRAMLLEGRWDYTDLGIMDRTHLRFFTKKTLIELFTNSAYNVTDINSTTITPENFEVMFDIGIDREIVRFLKTVVKNNNSLDFQYVCMATPVANYSEAKALNDNLFGEQSERQQVCDVSNNIKLFEKIIVEQKAEIESLHELDKMLRESLSWRVTAPLRFTKSVLKNKFKQFRDLTKLSSRFIQSKGGVIAVTKKTCFVLEQEGWLGVKQRLKNRGFTTFFSGRMKAPSAYLQVAAHGKYQLSESWPRYCYVPPAPPQDLAEQLSSLTQPVLFSIVVPVYNTPPSLLGKLLASVEAQWYPHWELILADDCSPNEQTQRDLAAINNDKVVAFRLDKNSGIAEATNAGLAKAKGEFVVLLDHDDELTPDCLYELAMCVKAHNPDYIYSDEDKIDANGLYVEPHFKPDWSPDTIMSTMYVCHLVCIRRGLLEKVGGLRSDYDGCQDWDLILRVTEKTNNIHHIPKVLYHWRVIEGSIATDIAAKSYVLDASKRVREDALVRRGLVGIVEPLPNIPGYFRVNYQPQGEPLVSIIIPTRDNHAVLQACLSSVLNNTNYHHFEILVIDNGSVEPKTLEYLASLGSNQKIKVIRHDAPFNFSELNNLGVQGAKGELFLFLNDDTEALAPDWLARMVGYAQLPHVGAVGAKLLYSGGERVQHAGLVNLEDGPGHAFLNASVQSPGYYLRNQLEYNWLAVTGACLMVARDKYVAVGGFDESFPVAYNDIDLCFSLHAAGFYQVVCQAAVLLHHESVSRGHDHLDEQKRLRLQQEKQRLFAKHPAYFQYDPFYSPNLHPNSIHFELAL